MIDQNTTLKFEIYDQLISWYRIWYSYSSRMGWAYDEYQRTGNIHDPIITKDDLEHLATIRENIEKVYYDGLFLKEIEQNLFSAYIPHTGVLYLNKLAKLINPFIVYNSGKYLEYTCNTRLLGDVETVDSKAINAFLFEVQQFAISFGYIEDAIVKLLSESVWYHEYTSLIKVEGYKNGVSVANDLNRVSATILPNIEPEPTEPGVKLTWKGDKTDLAELVYALYKSERITDTSTGQPVTQKELAIQVVSMLGLDSLDVVNLMRGRYGTKGKLSTRKAEEGRTFVNELQTLLKNRVLD